MSEHRRRFADLGAYESNVLDSSDEGATATETRVVAGLASGQFLLPSER